MRLNLRLIKASKFLQQFKLDVRYKPEKELIIPDVLSRLASANIGQTNPSYSELDTLFTYNTTLVEICSELISRILTGYKANKYWLRLQRQVQANNKLGIDKTFFLFVLGLIPPTDANPYLTPRLKIEAKVLPAPEVSRSLDESPQSHNTDGLALPDKTKLLYYVNKLTGIHCLYIPSSMAPDILVIAYKKRYQGFSYCYKIITCSWFDRRLTNLLQTFVCHYPQCLAFQTRRHAPYGFLQPIKSPPVPFFILILDFIFAFLVSADRFNALMSITCKFSKCITLIKRMDTWSAK